MNLVRNINLPPVTFEGFEKCRCLLHIKLENADTDRPVFTVHGTIGNFGIGGQVVDDIAKLYPDNKLVQRVFELWQKYHLNDMHAGCIHQREFEKEPYKNHEGAHCDICDYTYGTAWNYEPIPKDVLDEMIKDIFGVKEVL